jgi:hypothetical protein
VVADRGDHGDAQERHRAAQGFVAEREQVGQRPAAASHDHHLDLLDRSEVTQRGGDHRGGQAILHRGEPPDQPPGPAPALQAGQDVVPGLAALARHDPDRSGQERARQALLRLEQPVRLKAPAQALELDEQVSLARDA